MIQENGTIWCHLPGVYLNLKMPKNIKKKKKKKKKKSLFKRLSFPEKLREGVYSQIRCLRDEHVCVVEISGYFLKVMV